MYCARREVVSIQRGASLTNFAKSFLPGRRCISLFPQLYKGNQRRPRLAASGSASNEQFQSRRDATHELLGSANRAKWEEEKSMLTSLAGRIPTNPIYLMSEFEPKMYSLSEAVNCLREAAHPDMYDCMDNAVNVKLTVNMSTKKKTKFIQKFEAHVVFPHLLNFQPKNRILALCKESNDVNKCLNEGALEAGGENLLHRIEHGAFHWEEYDNVVSHPDWESHLFKLRHILKDRLPTSKNGRVGEDVSSLVSIYANGVGVASSPLHGVPEINFMNVIIGQLSWDIKQLEENFQCLIETCELHKSSRLEGNLFNSGELLCPPTGERFLLHISYFQSNLTPNSTVSDDDMPVEIMHSEEGIKENHSSKQQQQQ